MPINQESKTRIIENLINIRKIILKGIQLEAVAPGDHALMMIALAITGVTEVMLESQEISRVSLLPGEIPVVGGRN